MTTRPARVVLVLCAALAAMSVLVAQERPMQLDDTKVPKGRPAPRMANG